MLQKISSLKGPKNRTLSSYLLRSLQPFRDGLPHVGQVRIAITSGRNTNKAGRNSSHVRLGGRSNGGRRCGGLAAGIVFDVLGGDHAVHSAAAANPEEVDASLGGKVFGRGACERPVAGNRRSD
jgi:hypothetical protein